MRFVVPLSDLGRDDVTTAGGKAANPGELVQAGFPVPDGFVVTTEAYATAIQPLHLDIPAAIAKRSSSMHRAGSARPWSLAWSHLITTQSTAAA